MRPLDDLRILDLSRLVPGPYCTALLADLGAEVIKVESPDGGDYLRHLPLGGGDSLPLFAALNRNKRSIALDLRAESDRDAFIGLVETADVVVESFRPGVLDRLGVGYAILSARNPRVILCSITGYGQDGPYRDRAGHDLNFVGLSGALETLSGRPPVPPAIQVGDIGGGALPAVVAILAALHERERSGRGRHCDVAMLDALLPWMALRRAERRSIDDRTQDGVLLGGVPCYGVYPCADGYLTVAGLEERFWADFVDAIGRPDLLDGAYAHGTRGSEVRAAIEERLRSRTRAEWMGVFADRDACCEPVLDIEEAFDHPQIRHRLMSVPSGLTDPPSMGSWAKDMIGAPTRCAPILGQDTNEILARSRASDSGR